MATYVEILRSEFPEIDSEVFDYITGVLDCGGADFVDGEEVFEAVGGVLQGVSADSKNEDDIRDICQQMFNTLKLPDRGGVQAPAGRVRDHRGARGAPRRQPVWGAEEQSRLRTDDHAMGGVVLVSHDERLIRMVCKELWVCENGTVWRIDGGFDEYREILQEQFRKEGYL
ncbi:ATP-binding cassette sub-family F member 3 [Acipenser ruthenus]|uniref:ATP-binding cassette sub-family F member 3 n=1 Tax=Acipenser ruthenus TaxID=7906 RepID=A0A444U2C9_ACIRT|nr:ATP-binding cassette sub-family F member 3 [Acipenser ruthenus]